MVSQKARYALRAALVIAEHWQVRPVQIETIAARAKIPQRYLGFVLLELRKQGLLRSVRGRHGGYMLARPPESISFADILNVTDGVTQEGACLECAGRNCCRVKDVLGAARDARQQVLAAQTLAAAMMIGPEFVS